jgi:hypothetical protein
MMNPNLRNQDKKRGSVMQAQKTREFEPQVALGTEDVTRIGGNLDLVAPVDCKASVLLKLIDHEGTSDRMGRRYYAWWTMAGRYQALSASVPYVHDHRETLRVDIPVNAQISTEYLQARLRAFAAKDENLPPDTVIIKG